jgi:hypothetical protein
MRTNLSELFSTNKYNLFGLNFFFTTIYLLSGFEGEVQHLGGRSQVTQSKQVRHVDLLAAILPERGRKQSA